MAVNIDVENFGAEKQYITYMKTLSLWKINFFLD